MYSWHYRKWARLTRIKMIKRIKRIKTIKRMIKTDKNDGNDVSFLARPSENCCKVSVSMIVGMIKSES